MSFLTAVQIAAAFGAGVLAGALLAGVAFVVWAVRLHSRQEAAAFVAETTMADVRAKALQGGRFVETPGRVQ